MGSSEFDVCRPESFLCIFSFINLSMLWFCISGYMSVMWKFPVLELKVHNLKFRVYLFLKKWVEALGLLCICAKMGL
jgi:hypothetical protein